MKKLEIKVISTGFIDDHGEIIKRLLARKVLIVSDHSKNEEIILNVESTVDKDTIAKTIKSIETVTDVTIKEI